MKRCPACQSIYTDVTLVYCLQDGVPLETVADALNDGPETVIRARATEADTVAITTEELTNDGISQESVQGPDSAPAKRFSPLLTILLTVIVMLSIFGAVAVGAYFYINRGKTGEFVDGNTNSASNGTANAKPTSPGTNPAADRTPKPTRTPSPAPTAETPYKGDAVKEVSDRVYTWTSLAEARNLDAYMAFYGARVDYYSKRGASPGFVKNDKSKAFGKYTTIDITLSNMSVKPAKSGNQAEVSFDKEWLFENSSEKSTGKVRSQLVFRRENDEWKIVAEKDVKVYYVNK